MGTNEWCASNLKSQGVVCFAINFVMMARWALLDLEYHPARQAKQAK